MGHNTTGGAIGNEGDGRGQKRSDLERRIDRRVAELKRANFGQEPMNARSQAEHEIRDKDEHADRELRRARSVREQLSKAVQAKIDAGRAPKDSRSAISVSVSGETIAGLDELSRAWGLNRGRVIDEIVSLVIGEIRQLDDDGAGSALEDMDYDPDQGFVPKKKGKGKH